MTRRMVGTDARESLIPPLLLGATEDPARMRGHFALHRRRGSVHELVRDPLGAHKLFFALDGDEVRSASYLGALVREGLPACRVGSVPSGHVLRIDPSARRLELERLHEPGSRIGGAGGRRGDLGARAARRRRARGGALGRGRGPPRDA
ncbi:MAG: hypothetical protein M5U28_05395 [Sandaracinaceae bacterium]|nr:hypothetical protein [Sandaracinaceae bacterium]